MTRCLISARRIAAVVACLAVVAAWAPRAVAQEPVSGFDPDETAALAKKLGLSQQQQRAIRKIQDDARKSEVKLQAEIEVHSIDLRRELEQEDPQEKTVATLIEKIARLEGEVRKSRVLAGLAVRKVLSPAQRKQMETFRDDRHHRFEALGREAMERARIEMEGEAERIEAERRELEDEARDLEEQARHEVSEHKRELEQAARALRKRAREFDRQHRELERVRERALEEVREKVREKTREKTREKRGSGMATLHIESRQPAKVYLDGKQVGSTPYSGEVKAGEHKVELKWKKSSTKRVVTLKADSQVMLNLDPPK